MFIIIFSQQQGNILADLHVRISVLVRSFARHECDAVDTQTTASVITTSNVGLDEKGWKQETRKKKNETGSNNRNHSQYYEPQIKKSNKHKNKEKFSLIKSKHIRQVTTKTEHI